MALTAAEIKGIDKQGKHPVGGSLYLQVSPEGSKSWLYRYQINKRRRWMGLGGYPEVSLSKARDLRDHFKKNFIKLGIDPLSQKAQEKEKADAARHEQEKRRMTFAICAEAYIENNSPGWKNAKHAQQWQNTLTTYAYPIIGDMAVTDVDVGHVLDILNPIWLVKTETASRVRNRIELVLDYAKVLKYRDGENPARWRGSLDKTLPRPSKIAKHKHHPALPYDDMGAFMGALTKANGTGAKALTLTILCATRTSETLNATWNEFDLEKKIWIIPADRMKAEKEHRVPLSDKAITLLRGQEGLDPLYVFPGSKKGKPLSNMSMTTVLRRMERGDITVHGFRSTFRDWIAEKTTYAQRVAETALAHQLKDGAEAAYQRGDLIEKRVALMQDWADFCFKTKSTKVVSLQDKRQQKN
jgi:integrase